MTIKKIFLDMDGVICECVPAFVHLAEQTGLPLSYPLASAHDTSDQRLFYEFVERGLFATLPPMHDLPYLLSELEAIRHEYGITIEMLTSINTLDETTAQKTVEQKKAWLKQHGINYAFNFVNISFQKGDFATPDSVLIDDSATPIEHFLMNGGKTIAHLNAHDTIEHLRAMLGNP